METLVSIFREVRDPRDFNAQHDLAAMLFISLAPTPCGAKPRRPGFQFVRRLRQRPHRVCAVERRRFPVGVRPTRQLLQPEATGAAMEVTK
jgi:hypothetical protein